jgi:hypothetical protein
MSDVIQFLGISPKRGRASAKPQKDEPEQADWRSRASVKQDIEEHIAAREAFAKAVAWEAAAESQNLPPAQIEEARERTAKSFMQYRGQNLLIVMPTDRRALVDLLHYLEINFSVLPQECRGRSLAFDLLRTLRLSLRRSERYGKS